MKILLLVLSILLTGCGTPDAGDTEINIAEGESSAGDPVTNSGDCAESDGDCAENNNEPG